MARLLTVCLLGLALLPVGASARAGEARPAPMESVLISRVEGSIVIDTRGAVESFQIDSPMTAELRAGVERAISGWHFKPVIEDGKAIRVRSVMLVTLAGTRLDDGYRVKIDNVVFPGEKVKPGTLQVGRRIENASAALVLESISSPLYPAGMQHAGISGTVLVGFRIGADGRVAEATGVQSMIYDIRAHDRVMQAVVRQMEQVAVGAVKRWKFAVRPKADVLAPRDMTHYVHIVFLMENVPAEPRPGMWRTVVRNAAKPPTWLPAADAPRVGVADLAGGQMFSPDSRLVLTTDVAGTELM